MKAKITLLAVGALAGAAAMYWLWPRYVTKVETRTQTVVRNDVRTVTRTITRPDGTSETVKEIVDKSVKAASSSSSKITNKPNYVLGLTAGTHLDTFKPVYGLQGSMRVLGPFFIGAYAQANGELGVLVLGEF